MSKHVATLSPEGMVVVPEEVRKKLGLRPGDQIEFDSGDDGATMRRLPLTLEQLAGSVPAIPGSEHMDLEDMIEEAMQNHADWVVERMRRGEE